MKVKVLVFAGLREALGGERLTLELPEGARAEDVREALIQRNPRWRDLLRASRLAVGVEFVAEDHPLGDRDEVALIPPVSGGSAPPFTLLTEAPLDLDSLVEAATRSDAGAICTFQGTVRTPNLEKDVLHLEYEAHEAMAQAQMSRILEETRARWPGSQAFLHHRLGRVLPREVSVVVVVSTPHRGEAFEACRFVIEGLKHDVPIWKKEVYADGSSWVGSPGECAGEG